MAGAFSKAGNGFALGLAMSLAQGAVLPAMQWRPWSARSRAEVAFLVGEQHAAERVVQRLFGRPLAASEYAGLAGAPDDATVEVGASDGKLYVEMRDSATGACGYYYLYRAKTVVVLLNDGFCIRMKAMRAHGVGLQMFYRQARNTAAIGVDRIKTVAGRKDDENGYYTWPRYGFEGAIPASIRRLLPVGLEHCRTVLDLMSCERGRDWWKEHGETISVQFDLASGSRSRCALMRYVRERICEGGTKRNLENGTAMQYCIAR